MYCSCYNEPWVLRGHAKKLIRTKLIDPETAALDVPLPSAIGDDPLSHIGYGELKISSDTESEPFLCEDYSTHGRVWETEGFKEELCVPDVEPHIINLVDDLASEKHIDPVSGLKPLPFMSHVPLDATTEHDRKSAVSDFTIGYGLEEQNWQRVGSKADASTLTEPNLDGAASSPDAVEVPPEITDDSYITSTGEVGQIYSEECREAYMTEEIASETGLETNPLLCVARHQVANILDLGEVYKLAVGDKGKELSGLLTEMD